MPGGLLPAGQRCENSGSSPPVLTAAGGHLLFGLLRLSEPALFPGFGGSSRPSPPNTCTTLLQGWSLTAPLHVTTIIEQAFFSSLFLW